VPCRHPTSPERNGAYCQIGSARERVAGICAGFLSRQSSGDRRDSYPRDSGACRIGGFLQMLKGIGTAVSYSYDASRHRLSRGHEEAEPREGRPARSAPSRMSRTAQSRASLSRAPVEICKHYGKRFEMRAGRPSRRAELPGGLPCLSRPAFNPTSKMYRNKIILRHGRCTNGHSSASAYCAATRPP
jgi:hypothetical protein